LRFLLEEGKNNMLLRSVQQYIEALEPKATTPVTPTEALPAGAFVEPVSVDEDGGSATESELRSTFEFGMGRLLCNSFNYIESLQVTSPQLLILVVSKILTQRINKPIFETITNPKQTPMLGVSSLYWVQQMAKGLDRLDETRIGVETLKLNLLGLLAAFLCRHHAVMTDEHLLVGAEGLSLLCQMDDVRSSRIKLVKDPSIGPAMVALEGRFLSRLTDDDADARKRCRGLLDMIAFAKRKKVEALPADPLDVAPVASSDAATGSSGAAAGGGGEGSS